MNRITHAMPVLTVLFARSVHVSAVPKIVMPTAHSDIGMNDVQGSPVKSQHAPQITGTISAMP